MDDATGQSQPQAGQAPASGGESSDLAARLAALESRNASLQQALATERRARTGAETQAQTVAAQHAVLQQQHSLIRDSALEAMSPEQLREYTRTMESQTRAQEERERRGTALFRQGDALVSQLAVTDEEWGQHFDPSLTDPGLWRTNPTEAQVRLDRSLAALRAARAERAKVDASVKRQMELREEDQAHDRRAAAAAAGAFTPDRARGSAAPPATPWQTPGDVWSGFDPRHATDDSFDPDMAALRRSADLTAGKRPR